MASNFKKHPAFRPINKEHVDLLISKDIAAEAWYPHTLGIYLEKEGLTSIPPKLDAAISAQIVKLHESGFYHGDLHEYNIVFKVVDGEYIVRIIDFETLRTIDELKSDPDQLQILYDFVGALSNYEGFPCTLESLFKFELINYKFNIIVDTLKKISPN